MTIRTRTLATTTAVTLATLGGTVLLGTGGAQAEQFLGKTLLPGTSTCVSQWAGYQVRGDGYAAGGDNGARFKLIFRGTVLDSSPGRVPNYSVERRTSLGTFPGADYYSFCAYNTGTTTTTVQLRLRTDAEFS